MFKGLFKRKKKKENKTSVIISEENFRDITSGKICKGHFYKDGKKQEVSFFIDSNLSQEKMTSIICENFYTTKWRI